MNVGDDVQRNDVSSPYSRSRCLATIRKRVSNQKNELFRGVNLQLNKLTSPCFTCKLHFTRFLKVDMARLLSYKATSGLCSKKCRFYSFAMVLYIIMAYQLYEALTLFAPVM